MPGQMKGMNAMYVKAKYTTSMYVIFLYLVFIAVLFAGFASYISRVNLGAELAEAKVGSLDKVIYLTNRENEIRGKFEASRQELFLNQHEYHDLRLKKERAEAAMYEKTVALMDQFIPITPTISKNEDILDDEFVLRYRRLTQSVDMSFADQARYLGGTLASIQFRRGAPEDRVDEVTAGVLMVLNNYTRARGELHEAEAADELLQQQEILMLARRDEIRATLAQYSDELGKINESISNENRALIASFKNSFAEILYDLIRIPTIILTLIVTIAAGGLGSVVSFTKNFVRGEARATPGMLFVNVGEGVAAAVAIFLMAGAGMLMLTQGSGGGGSVELTPYMVAFIAFVSGFMAESAFARIQLAGKRIFDVSDAPPEAAQQTLPQSGQKPADGPAS